MKYNICVIAFLFFVAPNALAEIITFEHRSNTQVGGRIGNDSFRARFIITAIGDTGGRVRDGDRWIIEHLEASIEIEGIGTFDFVTPTRTLVSNTQELVAFSKAARAGGDGLLNGPSHPDFADWDMSTSIGPIRGGDGRILGGWSESPPVETTGGILFFDIWDNMDVTFTAAVIPAPGALALFGLAAFSTRRRRRM